MLQAKVSITVVEIECPYCGESIENADGAYLHPIYDLPLIAAIRCTSCGKDSELPTSVSKVLYRPTSKTSHV